MPKMNVKKTISVNANAEKIMSVIKDFNQWSVWSPWLILEPGVKVDVRKDGRSYSWEGKRVGSGEMSIESQDENKSIAMDLLFLKPWKSKAKVGFDLIENDSGIEVSWWMKSSLPFFMFWMKKTMEVMIGMDYKRGLEMLKEYIESGKVHSKLEFEGEGNYAGCKYIGITTNCSTDDIGPRMQKDFADLMEVCKENDLTPTSEPFSIYHKMEMVKNKTSYTAGIPVEAIPEKLPAAIKSSELPASKIFSIKHTGSYKHLGNPWTAAYMMIRNKEFKPTKKIHPFELYVSDPKEVNENELETRICFTLK